MPGVEVEGPDGNIYQFPDNTDKAAAISYFRAKGIGVEKSDAAANYDKYLQSGQPTSQERPKPFFERMGQAVKEDLRPLGHPGEFIHQVGETLRHPPYPEGGGIAASIKSLKERYSDPANLAGDVAAGYIGGKLGGGEIEQAETAAIPKKYRSAVEAKLKPPPELADYMAKVDKVNAKHAEALADYKTKLREAYDKGARKGTEPPTEPQRLAARKETLQTGSDAYVRKVQENLRDTYARGRADLDSRWGQFRTKMEGTELPAADVFNMIEEAKAKYLKGSPASLQVFNNLAREMGIQEFMEGDGGELKAIPGAGELPFDTARVHYSAIGDKLAGGGLPGNVYQALRAVSEGLDGELTKAAESRGAGEEYGKLKSEEHQFRSDWKDSDSPLAKALEAPDPNYLRSHVTGKGSDIMLQKMARYRKYGAQPHLTAAARRMANQSKAIKVPTRAGGLKLPSYPEIPEVGPPPGPAAPKAGKFARTAGRVAGKVAGGAVGSALGHPLLGYGIGGEVGTEAVEAITRRRAGLRPPPGAGQ